MSRSSSDARGILPSAVPGLTLDVLHFPKNPERGKMDPPLLDFSSHDDCMRRDDPRPTAGLALSVLTGLFHREWRRFLKG